MGRREASTSTSSSLKMDSGPKDWHIEKNSTEVARAVENEHAVASPGSILPSSSKQCPPNAEHEPPITCSSSVTNMRIPRCLPISSSDYDSLKNATSTPPVTRETLNELDLHSIMHNVSLRIDVNYDHDLHFMPVTGEKADEKKNKGREYWIALATELRIYLHNVVRCRECSSGSQNRQSQFSPRLPAMFETLRLLLEALVPDRDHPQVAENLDVDFLMQQVRHGVFDAARMSKWLANLLTCHCAPMRDAWAHQMAAAIEKGANDASMLTLVAGLEKLFSFLEAMKLDVANHQIRTLRYHLIEDTIGYQKDYFEQRIARGRLDTKQAKEWYQQACRSHLFPAANIKNRLKDSRFIALIHGFVWLCSPHVSNEHFERNLPVTLRYDRERFQRLRCEVEDLVYTRLAMQVFRDLLRLDEQNGLQPRVEQYAKERLWVITDSDSEEDVATLWLGNIAAVALEIAKLVLRLQPERFRPLDELVVGATQALERAFSQLLTDESNKTLTELQTSTIEEAQAFAKMTTLEMSEAQREWQPQQTQKMQTRYVPSIEDMARRLAHMSVLHWQVWQTLVYSEAFEEVFKELGVLEGVRAASTEARRGGKAFETMIPQTHDSGSLASGWQASVGCTGSDMEQQ